MLIDYGEIVVHIQHEEERQFYALERLWRDCPTIPLPADVTSRRGDAWLSSSCSGTAGPTWNHERRVQGQLDAELDDTGTRRPGGAPA